MPRASKHRLRPVNPKLVHFLRLARTRRPIFALDFLGLANNDEIDVSCCTRRDGTSKPAVRRIYGSRGGGGVILVEKGGGLVSFVCTSRGGAC